MFRQILTLVTCAILIFHFYEMDQEAEVKAELQHALTYVADDINYSEQDLKCLARNVYYEAGTEEHLGKVAVAQITVNRLKTGRWGNTICKVVYSPSQFSWTLKKDLPTPDLNKWYESMEIATNVLNGTRISTLSNSLFYHADYIRTPRWADPQSAITQIGRHIFYSRAKNTNISI